MVLFNSKGIYFPVEMGYIFARSPVEEPAMQAFLMGGCWIPAIQDSGRNMQFSQRSRPLSTPTLQASRWSALGLSQAYTHLFFSHPASAIEKFTTLNKRKAQVRKEGNTRKQR